MADGSVKYVRAVAHPSSGELPASFILIGAVVDITERKRTEETLREQANLLDLTHDAIFARDMNGVMTYWNRGAEALYGWKAEEARGKVASELLKTVFPVPSERIAAELRSRGYWEGELVQTKRDGTQVVVASRWSLRRSTHGRAGRGLKDGNDVSRATRRKSAKTASARGRSRASERVSMMGELAPRWPPEIKRPVAATVARRRLRAMSGVIHPPWKKHVTLLQKWSPPRCALPTSSIELAHSTDEGLPNGNPSISMTSFER
jgi:PAS domain S-box-containing protein